MNLRKYAQGQDCMIRSEYCNGDPETTVLAHIRRGGVAGMGQKPPDTVGVWACSACHDALDGRNGTLDPLVVLEALCRQHALYAQRGVVKW